MVCYNLERKLIYIHVPKTGGMTIERILIENFGFKNFTFPKGPYEFLRKKEGQEGFFKYILNHSEESEKYDLMSFRKFSFVRNPHKRATSGIRYLSERSMEVDKEFPSNLLDFYNYCEETPFFYIHFIMSQCTAIRDLNNQIDMEFIGRFENYNNDLEHMIFNLMGFERIDISKYHIHKSDPKLIEFNTDLVNELITTLHDEDFREFNY